MLDHSDDPTVERELDGNALAGLFESLFGGDMTVPGPLRALQHGEHGRGDAGVHGRPWRRTPLPGRQSGRPPHRPGAEGTYVDARAPRTPVFRRT